MKAVLWDVNDPKHWCFHPVGRLTCYCKRPCHGNCEERWAKMRETKGLGEVHDKIAEERTKFYGDPKVSHAAIGLATAAILFNRYQWLWDSCEVHGVKPSEFVPAELQALLFANFKNTRAARPIYRDDSYDDSHVYLGFSQTWREEAVAEQRRQDDMDSPKEYKEEFKLDPLSRKERDKIVSGTWREADDPQAQARMDRPKTAHASHQALQTCPTCGGEFGGHKFTCRYYRAPLPLVHEPGVTPVPGVPSEAIFSPELQKANKRIIELEEQNRDMRAKLGYPLTKTERDEIASVALEKAEIERHNKGVAFAEKQAHPKRRATNHVRARHDRRVVKAGRKK